MKRTPINRQSSKQASRGGFGFNSTIRKKADAKPLKQSNPERQAKSRKQYGQKLAAYRRSEAFKVVDQRAAGRCEFTVIYTEGGEPFPIRCDMTEGLEHHHKRYGKQFGGNERPEDIQVLCRPHHNYYESLKPTRRRRS